MWQSPLSIPEEEPFLQIDKAPTPAHGPQPAKPSAYLPYAFWPHASCFCSILDKHLFPDVVSEPYKAEARLKLIGIYSQSYCQWRANVRNRSLKESKTPLFLIGGVGCLGKTNRAFPPLHPPSLGFRNDPNKTITFRRKRKKKSLCNEVYRTNVPDKSCFHSYCWQRKEREHSSVERTEFFLDLLVIDYSPDTGLSLNLEAVGCLIGEGPGSDLTLPLVCCVTLGHILTSLCSVSANVYTSGAWGDL